MTKIATKIPYKQFLTGFRNCIQRNGYLSVEPRVTPSPIDWMVNQRQTTSERTILTGEKAHLALCSDVSTNHNKESQCIYNKPPSNE